jgi:hypothetical protein
MPDGHQTPPAHTHASKRFWQRAISPHVMSAPKSFIIRRNGRLPTVVSGAMYTFPLKSTVLFSRGCGFATSPPTPATVSTAAHAPSSSCSCSCSSSPASVTLCDLPAFKRARAALDLRKGTCFFRNDAAKSCGKKPHRSGHEVADGHPPT